MNHRCLEENTIVELVAGRLAPREAALAREHAERCPHCRDVVAATLLTRPGPRSGAGAEPDAGESAPTPDPQVRIGRYVIQRALGAGGMGVVYLAHDPELDRRVALKLLRAAPGNEADPQAAQEDLLREAQALARLSHPNVVAVHDAGRYGGRVFLAMEYVEGPTLNRWLRSARPSWRATLEVFIDAGRGLAAAHGVGLVHRDFKPDNVLVGDDGRVRVTDFGLARLARSPADGASLAAGSPSGGQASIEATSAHEGKVAGTPAYMAPEQREGRMADARSDQFAFCVALFEALDQGRPPGDSDEGRADRAGPASSGSRAPLALRRILLRGLARDSRDRFPTMDVLLGALGRCLHAARRRWLAAAAVLLAAGAAVLGHLLWRRPPPLECDRVARIAASRRSSFTCAPRWRWRPGSTIGQSGSIGMRWPSGSAPGIASALPERSRPSGWRS